MSDFKQYKLPNGTVLLCKDAKARQDHSDLVAALKDLAYESDEDLDLMKSSFIRNTNSLLGGTLTQTYKILPFNGNMICRKNGEMPVGLEASPFGLYGKFRPYIFYKATSAVTFPITVPANGSVQIPIEKAQTIKENVFRLQIGDDVASIDGWSERYIYDDYFEDITLQPNLQDTNGNRIDNVITSVYITNMGSYGTDVITVFNPTSSAIQIYNVNPLIEIQPRVRGYSWQTTDLLTQADQSNKDSLFMPVSHNHIWFEFTNGKWYDEDQPNAFNVNIHNAENYEVHWQLLVNNVWTELCTGTYLGWNTTNYINDLKQYRVYAVNTDTNEYFCYQFISNRDI